MMVGEEQVSVKFSILFDLSGVSAVCGYLCSGKELLLLLSCCFCHVVSCCFFSGELNVYGLFFSFKYKCVLLVDV